jgi:hypothetical protein
MELLSAASAKEEQRRVLQAGQAPRGLSDPADATGKHPRMERVETGTSCTRPVGPRRYYKPAHVNSSLPLLRQ